MSNSTNQLPVMTMEQGLAVEHILELLDGDARSIVLAGYAGTGKTFCLQHLIKKVRGRVIFTAPTNKAVRVLKETLTRDDYKPEDRKSVV